MRRLESETARFFLHIDRRAPASVAAMVEHELGPAANVRLLPRHSVHWASFGPVEATLEGVRALLEVPERLDYGVLLTGQDYPIKTAATIERYLADADGRSFLAYRPATGRFLRRVTRRHWHGTVLGRRVRVPNRFMPFSPRRELPGGLKPFTGSAHWCLSRACLEYVADVDRETVESFRHTAVPDESFFQTTLVNSPLNATIVNDDLRQIDWSLGGASPRVLTSYDLDRLRASHCLFARKFDPRVDAAVLDALDAMLDAGDGSERGLTLAR